jgi:ADP-heptose:LPS heptosyltransferase
MSLVREKALPLLRWPLDYARLTPSAVVLLSRHGRPSMFINAIGAGIGDDLLCTAIFRELRRRGQHDFWVTTRSAQLYQHNDDVSVIVPPRHGYDRLLKHLGTKVVTPWYTSYNPAFDRDEPMPQQHLISILCQKAGITGTISLKPYLVLTPGELQLGRRAPLQVAIQSSGLDARYPMRNKNWSFERYQGVVSALKNRYDFVQVGSRNDPPLEGALDLRGQTTVRETAAVLHGSLAFLGQVGFLMHLARAVECRSVIVYGGRETPAQSGYPCNENLYSAVSCSPCWQLNACPHERMCLQMIGIDDVVAAIEVQAERHGSPLAYDTDTITQEQIERNAARHAQAMEAQDMAWARLRQQGGRRINAAPAGMQVHERLEGQGWVFDGARLLVEVDYALNIVQELHTSTSPESGATELVTEQRIVYGVVESPQAPVLAEYVGASLRLQLHDARTLHFTVTKLMRKNLVLIHGLGGVHEAHGDQNGQTTMASSSGDGATLPALDKDHSG